MARLRGHSGLTDRGLVRGASAPSGAAIGQMWFNTGTGVLYQRTANVDGSSFWLDISSGGIGTSVSEGVDFVGDIDPHKATNGTGLAVGSVYYNREKNRHFVCTDASNNANVWAGRYQAGGGIVTDYESGGTFYKVHTFTETGVLMVEEAITVDYLVVAGGAGGGFTPGSWGGGGGGAGGFRESLAACSPTHTPSGHTVSPLKATTGITLTAQTYPITVGGGGTAGTGLSTGGGTSGGAGTANTGGGGGSGSWPTTVGGAGGSGVVIIRYRYQ